MAVFMSYCPQFWGSRVIYNDPKTRYMFESYDQKRVVFHVLWPFSWAIAHYFGALGGIYNDPKTRYMFVSYDQKLIVFAF